MRPSLVFPLLLSGCAFALRGIPARPDALNCARTTVEALGYAVVSHSSQAQPSVGSFRARKYLSVSGVYRDVAEITVGVWGERDGGTRIKVDAERFEEWRGSEPTPVPPRGVPVVGRPSEPVSVQIGSRRSGRRAIGLGPVAGDAQAVRGRCGRDAG